MPRPGTVSHPTAPGKLAPAPLWPSADRDSRVRGARAVWVATTGSSHAPRPQVASGVVESAAEYCSGHRAFIRTLTRSVSSQEAGRQVTDPEAQPLRLLGGSRGLPGPTRVHTRSDPEARAPSPPEAAAAIRVPVPMGSLQAHSGWLLLHGDCQWHLDFKTRSRARPLQSRSPVRVSVCTRVTVDHCWAGTPGAPSATQVLLVLS